MCVPLWSEVWRVQHRPEAGGLGSQILGVRPRSHAVDFQNSGAEVIVLYSPGQEALVSPEDVLGSIEMLRTGCLVPSPALPCPAFETMSTPAETQAASCKGSWAKSPGGLLLASWAFPLGLGPVPWVGGQVSVPPSPGPSVSL